MKIIPYLALSSFCTVFVACSSIDNRTAQEVYFSSNTPEHVLVSLNGKAIGRTPCSFILNRDASYNVSYSKEGYTTRSEIIEPTLDIDENGFPIQAHLVNQPAVDLLPVSAKPAPKKAIEKPAPAPVVKEEPTAEEEIIEEEATAEEAVAEEAIEEETAEEEVTEATPVATEKEAVKKEEPVAEEATTEESTAEEGEAKPEEAKEEATAEENNLSSTRSYSDIKSDLEVLKKQKQTGQISEEEFNTRCQKIGEEIKARYSK